MRNQPISRKAAAFGFSMAILATAIQTAIAEPPASNGPAAPAVVENFTLTDHAGVTHELYDLQDAPVIVIATQVNGDPLSREAVQSLESVKAIFKQAEYFLLNASPNDTRATIAKEAAALNDKIPILDDETGDVARRLGLSQTGEAIIVDTAGWKIVYRGPISAAAAADPDARYLLFNAVVHAVGHRPIDEPSVAVKGTPIVGASR